MSRGFGGYANLVLLDDTAAIYKYGGYNLNESKYRNKNHIQDGLITIQRSCFIEPEVHEKIRKVPSGKKKRKKLIVKRIPVDVDYTSMMHQGLIQIENCSNCWYTSKDDNIDFIACCLLSKIFRAYQEDGAIPEYIGYNV